MTLTIAAKTGERTVFARFDSETLAGTQIPFLLITSATTHSVYVDVIGTANDACALHTVIINKISAQLSPPELTYSPFRVQTHLTNSFFSAPLHLLGELNKGNIVRGA